MMNEKMLPKTALKIVEKIFCLLKKNLLKTKNDINTKEKNIV
jgi:hypothetical protein